MAVEEGSCIWEGKTSACRRGAVVVYNLATVGGARFLGSVVDGLHRSSRAPVDL